MNMQQILAKSRIERLNAFLSILKNQEKTIELETLGLKVSVPQNYHFHDDGYVKSISEHMNEIIKKYGEKYGLEERIEEEKITEKNKIYESVGCTMKIQLPEEVFVHIFYLDRGEKMNIAVRAHEETHTLQHFNRIDALEEKFLEQNVKINLSEYDGEIVASLGSVYALYSRGIDPKEIVIIEILRGRISNENFIEAIKIYEKAREKALDCKPWIANWIAKIGLGPKQH